jgi:transposase-like protein
MSKRVGQNNGIRYSEAFKMAVVREVEQADLPLTQARRKYGIRSTGTVQAWVRQYGNGSRGVRVRVEKLEEINELRRLRERVLRLESALADAHIQMALEGAYTQLACERAGMDVEEFKKKAAGQLRTKRWSGRPHGPGVCNRCLGVPAGGHEPAELAAA